MSDPVEGRCSPQPSPPGVAELSPLRRELLARWMRRGPVLPAMGRRADPGVHPLSFAQQRLWFLEQLAPGTAVYSMPAAVHLAGRLCRGALQASLGAILGRHEALRARFENAGGGPVQWIEAAATPALPLVDLEGLAPDRREPEAARLAGQEAARPFDLARGPLLRGLLLRLGPEEHVLVVVMHHIASDGWSLGVFVRELAALYEAAAAGEPSPLPDLIVQYADFAQWQRDWLRGEVLERHLRYWKSQLGGGLPVFHLPGDRPRPAAPTFRGVQRLSRLPAPLTEALRRQSRRGGGTLFMLLLAAFQALLHRYTGAERICLGSPIANRSRREVEGLIGFFVNALVLRVDLAADLPFSDLLRRVREVALGAYAHQDLPFELLVEALHPERRLRHSPLFDVVFVLQNAPMAPLELPGLTLRPVEVHSGTAKFDLVLSMVESDDRLLAALEHSLDLYDPATAERLLDHFRRLLEEVSMDPLRPIGDLPLMSAEERRQAVAGEAALEEPAAPLHCLGSLFEDQVRSAPDAVALSCDGRSLTYGELGRRADRLAGSLCALGAAPEHVVGVLAERSPDLIVGLVAVVRSGAAFLPLDPVWPEQRLSAALDGAGASLVLVQSSLRHRLPPGGVPAVELDAARITAAAVASTAAGATGPPGSRDPYRLAYVIYTSGSTGRPGGVMVDHVNVVRLLAAAQPWFGFGRQDTWTLFHSCAFDFSVWEIWGALLSGGRLAVVSQEVSRAPEELHALLVREQVTVLNQTPSAFRQLVRADARLAPGAGLALRWIVFGGEALDLRSLEPWIARYGDERPRLANMYGITETTVHVTWRRLTAGDPAAAPGSMIGRPLPDLKIHLLDHRGEPVPPGVPGEIHVGGPGLARGYLGLPGRTAERFVPDPFGRAPGGRLYRSGDLARRTAGGDLEYLGRIDHQIKIRGHRVETGEVAAALATHPAVAAAVVLPQGEAGSEAGVRLVAYVVPEEPAESADTVPEGESELLEEHRMVFDATYGGTPPDADPAFNIQGWVSSYSGLPIPRDEMGEWVDATVERILSLLPRRVLEIGCGTGLILGRLAPVCERYLASDLSAEALAAVRRSLAATGCEGCAVELARQSALEAVAGPEPVDTVILSSVAQYFPGLDYLERVLAGAVSRVPDGGRVFLGDVRSLPLLEAFHTSVVLAGAAPATPLDEVRRRIRRRLEREDELVLDPLFFFALQHRMPRIGQVEIHHRRGRCHNEMTRFRYDVILHVGPYGEPPDTSWLDWRRDGLSLCSLRRLLEAGDGEELRVARVPNARLRREVKAVELLADPQGPATLASLRQAVEAADDGVDPEDLYALCDGTPYRAELQWSAGGAEDELSAIFLRRSPGAVATPATPGRPFGLSSSALERPWASLASRPLRARRARRLVPELRDHLERRLPEFMVPASFVLLPDLPLTPNGKVDRRALPPPDAERPDLDRPFVAPRTPAEVAVARLWSRVLGIGRAGIHDSFFDLGGHSLLATELLFRLRDEMGLELPLRLLFEEPTIEGIARTVERVRGSGLAAAVRESATPDLRADAVLAEEIRPLAPAPLPDPDPAAVLLTGATGFFGAALLAELLQSTRAEVFCLVRAAGLDDARRRLREAGIRYGVWDESRESRVTPVVGDLSRPRLGLSADAFHRLAERIGAIYHNGALVNFVYPYAALRAPNVDGTREILRLACLGRPRPVHFVSSLYVFSRGDWAGRQRLLETDVPEHGEQLALGYLQSKWVAERLVSTAGRRGVPVSIYRLDRIAGHSATGACQEEDFLWRLLRACVQTGLAPELDLDVTLVPVDFASRVLVHLSRLPGSAGRTFHLTSPRPLPWHALIGWMRAFGYRLDSVPYERWRSEMLRLSRQSPQTGLGSLAPLFVQPAGEAQGDAAATLPRIEMDGTLAGLAGTGWEYPEVDGRLLSTYFGYFIRRGFLDPPTAGGDNAAQREEPS